jgi:hypothetical protein
MMMLQIKQITLKMLILITIHIHIQFKPQNFNKFSKKVMISNQINNGMDLFDILHYLFQNNKGLNSLEQK